MQAMQQPSGSKRGSDGDFSGTSSKTRNIEDAVFDFPDEPALLPDGMIKDAKLGKSQLVNGPMIFPFLAGAVYLAFFVLQENG